MRTMPKAPPSGSPHPAAVAGVVAAVVVGLALLASRDRPVFSPPPANAEEPAEPSASAAPVASVAPSASARRPVAPVPVIRRPLLTDAQRDKGLNECATPDPGEGSLRPKKLFPWGVIQLPRSGGHTGDYGYDVVIHFHGADGARKALAPLGTGLTLVGVDRGEGSGSYDQIFPLPVTFEAFRRAITGMLISESKHPEAHIRHLALSSWSAGYGATVSILRNAGDAEVDAVIFLDSLHASYNPDAKGSGKGPDAIYPPSVAPVLAFADRAKRGEKAFFLTHSHIVPPGYPSTTEVAQLLVRSLDVQRLAAPPADDPFALLTYTENRSLQIRSFRGPNELAHCTHLAYFADAVMDVLIPRWGTPPIADH